jgi:hypothetical protein
MMSLQPPAILPMLKRAVELVRSESFDWLVEKINASLDELLESIKSDWTNLGPVIDLEAVREPQGSRTEGGSTVGNRTIEDGWRSGA